MKWVRFAVSECSLYGLYVCTILNDFGISQVKENNGKMVKCVHLPEALPFSVLWKNPNHRNWHMCF